MNQKQNQEVGVGRPPTSSSPPPHVSAGRPKAALLFWFSPPPPPPHVSAGHPKAALLFWFFDGFRCGVPLFIVIRVIYKYKNG